MSELVITAVGPDRAGLVDELTGYLLEAGANIGDSRMVHFGGQFALILEVTPREGDVSALRAGLPGVGQKIGLAVTVSSPTQATDAAPSLSNRETTVDTGATTCRVRLSARDQPGIVHRVTHALRAFGINIEELVTTLTSTAYGDKPRFNMDATVTLPAGVSVDDVRATLAQLSEPLDCEVDLEAQSATN